MVKLQTETVKDGVTHIHEDAINFNKVVDDMRAQQVGHPHFQEIAHHMFNDLFMRAREDAGEDLSVDVTTSELAQMDLGRASLSTPPVRGSMVVLKARGACLLEVLKISEFTDPREAKFHEWRMLTDAGFVDELLAAEQALPEGLDLVEAWEPAFAKRFGLI